MCRIALAVAVGFLLPLGSSAQADRALQQVSARQVDIVANDYTFLPLPQTIPAGPTLFGFTNQGKVQHEVSLVRLKRGVTVDQVVKAVQAGERARQFVDRSVGILIAGPGLSPDGRLLVDLRVGETYLLLCTLRDNPDAPPHIMLGMFTSFRPQP